LRCRREIGYTPAMRQPLSLSRLQGVVFAALSFGALAGCSSIPYRPFALRADTRPPKALKVLLVATSDDGARFASSVLKMRQTWLDRGIRPDEIACYLTAPIERRWEKYSDLYESMRPSFSGCYPATLPLLRKHLAAVAKNPPEFVHVMLSGHGGAPLEILERLDDQEGLDELRKLQKLVPGIGHWNIPFEEHGEFSWPERLLRGEPLDDVVLTPVGLAELLKLLPETTRKVVVLQGCFTGGFLEAWTVGGRKTSLLAEVPNLTVLTSAAATRYSFGNFMDDSGVFADGLTSALAAQKTTASRLDWKKVYEHAAREVESAERIVPPGFESLPQFGTNAATRSHADVSPPSQAGSTR
jgi:hypothetical protein